MHSATYKFLDDKSSLLLYLESFWDSEQYHEVVDTDIKNKSQHKIQIHMPEMLKSTWFVAIYFIVCWGVIGGR